MITSSRCETSTLQETDLVRNANDASRCGALRRMKRNDCPPFRAVRENSLGNKNMRENAKMERRIVKRSDEDSKYQKRTFSGGRTWERVTLGLMLTNPDKNDRGRGSFLELQRNRRFLHKFNRGIDCRVLLDTGLVPGKLLRLGLD